MRKTMFLIVSLMLMGTPTHANALVEFWSDCKAIEKELDNWLMAIGNQFHEFADNSAITLAMEPQGYDLNTKMAERWATIYIAKCPAK